MTLDGGGLRELDGSASLHAALAEVRRENAQLRRALESRIAIEQAKGVLAERYATRVEDAFDLLRRAARSSNRTVRGLATDVLESAETPPSIVRELGRRGR